jgi:hypothetical protein
MIAASGSARRHWIPAFAGMTMLRRRWIPAFAGMTML